MMKSYALKIGLFFISVLIVFDIGLIYKNHKLRSSIKESLAQDSKTIISNDFKLEESQYFIESMVRLPNISIENGEKKLTLSQVVERTRLLIYIPKDICNSCLISLFEEIGRHLTKNIWNKIVIIKTVNLDNEIDFSSIGMKQYYTSFELNFILENNISNKVVLMVIDNNLKISMVHIPSDVIDARTTNFLQIVREYDEFKEEAN